MPLQGSGAELIPADLSRIAIRWREDLCIILDFFFMESAPPGAPGDPPILQVFAGAPRDPGDLHCLPVALPGP